MKKKEYLEQLAHFVSGSTSFETFQEYVEDELAALREHRRPSEEKAQLSRLELVLHEVQEDARERFDAYALALALLQRALKEPCPPESGFIKSSLDVVSVPSRGTGPARLGWETETDEPTRYHLSLAETKA